MLLKNVAKLQNKNHTMVDPDDDSNIKKTNPKKRRLNSSASALQEIDQQELQDYSVNYARDAGVIYGLIPMVRRW